MSDGYWLITLCRVAAYIWISALNDQPCPAAAIAYTVVKSPNFGEAYHVRVPFGEIVQGAWGDIQEYIHHLGGNPVVKLKLKGFDDRFSGAAVTAASI